MKAQWLPVSAAGNSHLHKQCCFAKEHLSYSRGIGSSKENSLQEVSTTPTPDRASSNETQDDQGSSV